jgi:hypothetical protein
MSDTNDKLVALTASTQQKHFCDEDFVIPTTKIQPRHLQRYIHKVRSLSPANGSYCNTNTQSKTEFLVIVLAMLSFSRFAYHNLNDNKVCKSIFQQLIKLRNILSYRIKRPVTSVVDDIVDLTVPWNSTIVADEPAKILTTSADTTDSASLSLVIDWKKQYEDLVTETAILQQKMLHMTQLLQQKEIQSTAAENGNYNDTESLSEIQSLNDTIQYWKRVAQMNEQQVSTVLKTERQNSIKQLEQLKLEMLNVVEQERTNMYNEFHSMVQQLRESLIGNAG